MQQNVVGESLILVGAQLQQSHSASQCVIQVFGVSKQLFILGGLESQSVSDPDSHIYSEVLLRLRLIVRKNERLTTVKAPVRRGGLSVSNKNVTFFILKQ